jgi:hypothetical protein
MSDLKLKPITNFDPLRNLFEHFKLTPLTLGVLIFILDLIVDGLLCVMYQYLYNSSLLITPSKDTLGLLEDYMAIITDFIYTPVIAGVYLWSIDGSAEVFQRLLKSKVFKSDQELANLFDRYRLLYNKKSVFYFFFIVSVLFSLLQTAAYNNLLPWKAVGGYIEIWPAASYGRAPFWFLMLYSVLFLAFNVGVTIYILRKAFGSGNIQLAPLHPDNCGGLGGISKYSNKIALGIGSVGLLLSAATVMELQNGSLPDAYPVILGIVTYLILAPLFFFLPLGTAHDAMQEAKDAELLKLADRFRLVYDSVKNSADQSSKKFNDELSKLENVKKLYSLAESFPVWPFDVQNLRRFLAVVTTPLLPALISIINNILAVYFRF